MTSKLSGLFRGNIKFLSLRKQTFIKQFFTEEFFVKSIINF